MHISAYLHMPQHRYAVDALSNVYAAQCYRLLWKVMFTLRLIISFNFYFSCHKNVQEQQHKIDWSIDWSL